MAKNRVAPDRPVTKRDNFFTKPKSNFKAKTKTDQFKTQSNFPVKKNRLVNINNESNKTNNYFTSTKTKIMKPSKQSTQNNDVEIKEKKPFDKKSGVSKNIVINTNCNNGRIRGKRQFCVAIIKMSKMIEINLMYRKFTRKNNKSMKTLMVFVQLMRKMKTI